MSSMRDHVDTMREVLGRRICEALLSRGYASAVYAATAEEAARIALSMPEAGQSVGIPGSVTIRELGLIEKYEAKGCRVHHHWRKLSKQEADDERNAENAADWYVTSSNAITYDGRMVNIDGAGNRVAAMSWGTGKILYIVSVGKACPDVDSAIKRIRDRAVAPNALRLGYETPCVKAGACVDCLSPDRTCRVVTIVEYAPMGRECRAIIVGEDLGY